MNPENVLTWNNAKVLPKEADEVVYFTKAGEKKIGTFYEVDGVKRIGDGFWYEVMLWAFVADPTPEQVAKAKKENTLM
jgi:hypothetical protein